ncbi:MAG: biotin--[acetyl-CoA-carboxylase] ligase [Candidatus Sabulitectum sp.]|nr:biotin--[acetyl-CoA-carboxylase] ligase [Candidatus Sabulitectum sp.]
MGYSVAVAQILRSSSGYVSGEEIAKTLGVTRASVWKCVKNLRNMGFDVSASTNKGYKLESVPDVPSAPVLSSLLSTSLIGKTIEYHEQISSTNDRAMTLGLSGAPSGTVVTASMQSSGKARNGETWSSPSGKNLYLSILIRPEVSLARAKEIADLALESLYLSVIRFFPESGFLFNSDGLFFHEKKLGGVLCDVRGEIDRIHHMAVGIGLNVSHSENASGAGSLFSLTGKMLSRAEFTVASLEEFEKLYLTWKDNE